MNNYTRISILFAVIIVISNIASTKMVAIGGFTFDGGTLLFPFSYIFGDILAEIYKYERTKKVIWMGFIGSILASVTFMVVGILPPAVDWPNQDAYEKILYNTPRIVIASLLAYLVGSFSNAKVLLNIGLWTDGKYLWVRTIGSTIVGQFFDTILFVPIAFYGLLTDEQLFNIFWSNYLLKVLVEILFTPITYKVIYSLKRKRN